MGELGTRAIGYLYLLPAVILAFSGHELAHAAVAVLLGDDTPKKLGRLTLNPLKHLDPFGLLMVLLFGFGWARPVEYNPANLKRPAEGSVLIAVAGPFANLVLCVLSVGILALARASGTGWLASFAEKSASVNAGLFIFNLMPIPPLDGSHLLFWAIPERFQRARQLFLFYGRFALLALVLVSALANVDPLLVGTMANSLLKALTRLFRLA
jgi:Zn-dependent protease